MKNLFLALTLASSVHASRVGSVGLYKSEMNEALGLITECWVNSDGVTLRTSAGGMFDPDKLIVNKRVDGKDFFGFKALEGKFESFAKSSPQKSTGAVGTMSLSYEAQTFNAKDNPIRFVLYKQASNGNIEQRTEKLAQQYRAFLDAVCK